MKKNAILLGFSAIVLSYFAHLGYFYLKFGEVKSPNDVFLSLQGEWKIVFADRQEFSRYDFSDSGLSVINAPVLEKKDFPLRKKMRGWYWYRKTFDLSQAIPRQGLSLFLGKVKDKYELYLNGVAIGTGAGRFNWQTTFPSNILCSSAQTDNPGYCQGGKNVLAVRVYSQLHLFPGIAHLAPVGIAIDTVEDNTNRFIDYYLKTNTLHLINFVLTLAFSLVMFFAFSISKFRAAYFLYFSLYLFCSLPMIVFNFGFFDEVLPMESMLRLANISLGITPILFLSFCLDFFCYRDGVHRKFRLIVLSWIGFVAIRAATFGVESPDAIQHIHNWMSYYSYLGTLAYCFAFVMGLLLLKRKNRVQANVSPTITKWFVLILVPFVAGKVLENAILEILGSQSPGWVFINLRHMSQGYVLFFIPFMVGLIGYRYAYEQERNQQFAQSRIRILEALEKTSKDIPLPVVFKILLDRISEIVGSERGSIAIFDESNIPRVSCFYGIEDINAYDEEVCQDPRLQALIGQKKDLLIEDLSLAPYNIPNDSQKYGSGSAMIFLLRSNDKHYGYLFLSSKKNKDVFTADDFITIQSLIPRISAYMENRELYQTLNEQYEGVVRAFAEAIQQKSDYTKFHSTGVGDTLAYLAKKINLPYTRELKTAALLHDLGKIFIDGYILEKPGRLNDEELEIVRSHPGYSGQILESIPGFENIAKWASMHHESFDGKGYPYGVRGDNFPLEAQLISAADFIDALATNRAYRARLPFDKIAEIIESSVDKFSPQIRTAMLSLLSDKDFQHYYDLKGLDFKAKRAPGDAKLDYINERVESMHKSLISALDLIDQLGEIKQIDRKLRFSVMYNLELFNDKYETFVDALADSMRKDLIESPKVFGFKRDKEAS